MDYLDVPKPVAGLSGTQGIHIDVQCQGTIAVLRREAGAATQPRLVLEIEEAPETASPALVNPEPVNPALVNPEPVNPALVNPAGGIVVNATGDVADCGSDGDEAVADLLTTIPGPILLLGDIAYDSGTAQEFTDCFEPAWGQHKARIRPAAGNHEYLTPDAAPYFAYFGAAAGDPDKGYYSYDLGDWHIVVLNSNCSKVGGCQPESPQGQWLRADLASNPTHCTLAYFHHPRWSSGKYQVNDRVQPLVQALYDHGVEFFLSGHAHSYERFAPQTPDGELDEVRGIRQFVVGTGGKNLQPVDIGILPNSQVRSNEAFGVLTLTLHPSEYVWQFEPVAGSLFNDSGRGSCH